MGNMYKTHRKLAIAGNQERRAFAIHTHLPVVSVSDVIETGPSHQDPNNVQMSATAIVADGGKQYEVTVTGEYWLGNPAKQGHLEQHSMKYKAL